eukprot:CAMPEP_0119362122 /NCGR_PEP_ID=MMETSP1334-20130426/9273_1 /TAXON_ID=127549 /ORGANISM="Calcidiscus leptoporus, Strain RCC1130" /LENGTH=278 /DNA_ID=CAMNT_0007377291 /DNA_START=98 /DNA_END=933 /DNA_ORIENTATION=+
MSLAVISSSSSASTFSILSFPASSFATPSPCSPSNRAPSISSKCCASSRWLCVRSLAAALGKTLALNCESVESGRADAESAATAIQAAVAAVRLKGALAKAEAAARDVARVDAREEALQGQRERSQVHRVAPTQPLAAYRLVEEALCARRRQASGWRQTVKPLEHEAAARPRRIFLVQALRQRRRAFATSDLRSEASANLAARAAGPPTDLRSDALRQPDGLPAGGHVAHLEASHFPVAVAAVALTLAPSVRRTRGPPRVLVHGAAELAPAACVVLAT